MTRRNRFQATLAIVVLGLALAPALARAQVTDGAGGGRHGGGRRQHAAPAATDTPDAPKLAPEPLQRLDAGALVCKTEAALQQHEAAIVARLNGTEAPEPTGCRIVQSRTAVAVLDRHGQSRTEVRVPGSPEQIGWTDTMVRNQ